MTTCRDIIYSATSRIGIRAAGRDLTANEAQQGLEVLVALYGTWVGQGVFGRMIDVRLEDGADYTAREQERISANDTTTIDVTLPDTISDEWDVDGIGYSSGYDYGFRPGGPGLCLITARPPRDQSIVIVASLCDCTQVIYVYDGTEPRWQKVNDLTLNDTAPLALRYRKALTDTLAGNLADYYGQEVSASLRNDIAKANSMISHKWDRPRREMAGAYF